MERGEDITSEHLPHRRGPNLLQRLPAALLLTRGIMKLCVSSKKCCLSKALWSSDERFLWIPCGSDQG